MNICLAVSGNLGFKVLQELRDKIQLSFILTNGQSKNIMLYCEENNIPCIVGNPRDYEVKNKILAQNRPDILFSINYIYLFDEDLIRFPKKHALNIHGSLLPKYRGRTPHIWALINGENEFGFTIHRLSLGCDEGDILLQKKFQIQHTDTGADLLKVFDQEYSDSIFYVLNNIDLLKPVKQNESEASIFPKRTPEDGLINWNQSSLQIYNWVRALAPPYPGAFFIFRDLKYFVYKIRLTGQASSFLPGKFDVLENNKLMVHTKDEIIEIIEMTNKEKFLEGMKGFGNE